MPITYTCQYCGKEASCAPRQVSRGGGKYCSRRCCILANRRFGADNPKFIGSKIVNGYRYIRTPDHPRAGIDKYVPEHWLVLEAKIGRYLKPGEQAHHINKVRDDNRPENLILVNEADHNRLYHTDGQWYTCRKCGKQFWRTPCQIKKNKTGVLACSHSCAAFLRSLAKIATRLNK